MLPRSTVLIGAGVLLAATIGGILFTGFPGTGLDAGFSQIGDIDANANTVTGTVTRQLPDSAAPGESVTVILQFNLSEPRTVAVEETITGANVDKKRMVPQQIKDGRIFYVVRVNDNPPGQLTFSGELPELGIPVTGDDTVPITQR